MKRILLLLYALFTASSLSAEGWEFDLSLFQEQREIAEVTVVTDGKVLMSINKPSLIKALTPLVTPDIIQLLQQRTGHFSTRELKELGIDIQFDPLALKLDLILDMSIARPQSLTMYGNSEPGPYSESAFWNIQHRFNAIGDYDISNEAFESRLEILGAGNIGGYRGLNGSYALYVDNDEDETTVSRGETFLFWEKPEVPWRLSGGDLYNETRGHLPSLNFGGMNWSRSYSQLQPYRQLDSNSGQLLVLRESATVIIYVNNLRQRTLQLPPGRYDIADLPLSSGTNLVRLEITYASGERETINYSEFYNADLLLEGISNFDLSVGVESVFDDDGISYGDQTFVSGFYEYGLSDSWTLGGNGLYHPEGQLAGIAAVNGSFIGNVSLRGTASRADVDDETYGSNISIDYSQSIFGALDFGVPNFRLGTEYLIDFSSTPWREDSLDSGYRVSIDYRWTITNNIDFYLYASQSDLEDDDSLITNAKSQLTWNYSNWSVTAGTDYSTDPDEDEWNGYINIEYYFFNASSNTRLSASYMGEDNTYRGQATRYTENYVGGWGYDISAEVNDNGQIYDASSDYQGNRFRGEIAASYVYDDESGADASSVTTTLSSSVIVADGHWAWSRQSLGPIVLAEVHPTLEGLDVDINPTDTAKMEQISTASIANIALLPRSHDTNFVTYDAPYAPIGYDLGDGVWSVRPGSLTAHVKTVGSDSSYTVIGTALNSSETPLALMQGVLIAEDGTQHDLFTNRAGRFAVEGLKPGRYTIRITNYSLEFSVNPNEGSLVYLNVLILAEEGAL